MDEQRLSQLARALQGGDRAAFREMVTSMTRPLLGLAYRYTQDWTSAQDITQETWIKVHTRISRFDLQRPFQPWLLRIHRNHCLTHLRRLHRERARMAQQAHAAQQASQNLGGGDAHLGIPQRPRDPWDDLREREFGRQLRGALLRLSPRQRMVFALVDIEQTDQQEAARLLDMRHATLRTTLHFARRRLARLLRRMGESE